MKTFEELKDLFLKANQQFINENKALLDNDVSERALCAALMASIRDVMRQDSSYKNYYADVEYNRKIIGQGQWTQKTIPSPKEGRIIVCDLIVHSRGTQKQDNLIALEMKKKSNANKDDQKDDQKRLQKLTCDSTKKTPSKYIYEYVIGIYYEINYKEKNILIEYYRHGKKISKETISFSI